MNYLRKNKYFTAALICCVLVGGYSELSFGRSQQRSFIHITQPGWEVVATEKGAFKRHIPCNSVYQQTRYGDWAQLMPNSPSARFAHAQLDSVHDNFSRIFEPMFMPKMPPMPTFAGHHPAFYGHTPFYHHWDDFAFEDIKKGHVVDKINNEMPGVRSILNQKGRTFHVGDSESDHELYFHLPSRKHSQESPLGLVYFRAPNANNPSTPHEEYHYLKTSEAATDLKRKLVEHEFGETFPSMIERHFKN